MSLLEMREDLCGVKRVSRSKITYDINYDQEVIHVQEGWSDGQKTVWDRDISVVEVDALVKHKGGFKHD